MKSLLHPLPIRVFHWTMFFSVIALMFTGLYMDNPWSWLNVSMKMVRKIHTFFSCIVTVNLAAHIYYYFYTNKISEIILLPRDWSNVPGFLRYVFFITKGHPNFGHYNPGQKLIFSLWFLAVTLAAITGSVLLFPDNTHWLQLHLGGLNQIRIVHYSIAILFVVTVPLHLYLVFTESPANLQAMFTGYINKELVIRNSNHEKQGEYLENE